MVVTECPVVVTVSDGCDRVSGGCDRVPGGSNLERLTPAHSEGPSWGKNCTGAGGPRGGRWTTWGQVDHTEAGGSHEGRWTSWGQVAPPWDSPHILKEQDMAQARPLKAHP